MITALHMNVKEVKDKLIAIRDSLAESDEWVGKITYEMVIKDIEKSLFERGYILKYDYSSGYIYGYSVGEDIAFRATTVGELISLLNSEIKNLEVAGDNDTCTPSKIVVDLLTGYMKPTSKDQYKDRINLEVDLIIDLSKNASELCGYKLVPITPEGSKPHEDISVEQATSHFCGTIKEDTPKTPFEGIGCFLIGAVLGCILAFIL